MPGFRQSCARIPGEFEAAQNGALPKLIRQQDIRGDLHMHNDRDGRQSHAA